jgi:hypothetical protein
MKLMPGMALAASLLAAAGCGSDPRPSAEEVARSIKDASSVFGDLVPPEIADCLARILVESDLSDGTLNAVVDGDADYKGSKDDEDVLSELTPSFVAECELS